MRAFFRTTALVTLTLFVSGQSGMAADPFEELEKEAPSDSSSRSGKSAAQKYEEYKQKQLAEYEKYKQKLLENYAKYKQINDEEQERFESAVGEHWDDPATSTRTEWVEYSKDLKERRRVDFENETIKIEVEVDAQGEAGEQEVRESLKELIEKDRAQAFADDVVSSAVEERSKQEVELLETAPIKPEPLLSAVLTGEAETSDAEIDEIVDHMMESAVQSLSEDKGRKIQTIEVPLSAPPSVLAKAAAAPGRTGQQTRDKLPTRARTVWPHVDKSANQMKVPQALVLAVIETESAFNPQARSGIPAYGLMQIVPRSAGVDATEQLFGKGRILAPSYLYDSANNIEIGSTYLNILLYRYLKGIDDPLSRLYCSVAAYNTGAGNVSRAFIGTTRISNAYSMINSMTPQEVYDHLIANLPHEETRKYLKRVDKRIKKYEEIGV